MRLLLVHSISSDVIRIPDTTALSISMLAIPDPPSSLCDTIYRMVIVGFFI